MSILVSNKCPVISRLSVCIYGRSYRCTAIG